MLPPVFHSKFYQQTVVRTFVELTYFHIIIIFTKSHMNLNHLNVQKIALISIHLLVVMNYI